MSFDVILVHFQNGESAPANRQAVLSVVRSYAAVTINEAGGYDVPLRAEKMRKREKMGSRKRWGREEKMGSRLAFE
jgi:hypothetical protein